MFAGGNALFSGVPGGGPQRGTPPRPRADGLAAGRAADCGRHWPGGGAGCAHAALPALVELPCTVDAIGEGALPRWWPSGQAAARQRLKLGAGFYPHPPRHGGIACPRNRRGAGREAAAVGNVGVKGVNKTTNIIFDELSTLRLPSGSLQTALDKVAAALGSVGDAGQQARQVVDELRASLQAAAVQGVKSAAALPNLMRSTACPPRRRKRPPLPPKKNRRPKPPPKRQNPPPAPRRQHPPQR